MESRWRDAVRKVACELDPLTGEMRMHAVARTLVELAQAGDVAAIKELGDRVDGRVNAQPNSDGTTNISFVVALPPVAHASDWGRRIEARQTLEHHVTLDDPTAGREAVATWAREAMSEPVELERDAGVTAERVYDASQGDEATKQASEGKAASDDAGAKDEASRSNVVAIQSHMDTR